MTRIEKLRSEYKTYDRWYYHMVLDSLGSMNLFNDEGEYVNGMNALAIGQFVNGVGIIQFDWMRNHGHFILLATGLQCCLLFDYLRFKINSRLIKDGFPPLPDDWFFLLNRLDTVDELLNGISYSARNSYDARRDMLPSGYLWSSNYLMYSEISKLIEYRTVASIGVRGMARILGSKVRLPDGYKVSKLGYILPESYLLMTGDGSMTKARSLFKDSKDYAYRLFKDYDAYRRTASDLGETWVPSGGDVDSLIQNLLNIKYGVTNVSSLNPDSRCDLAVTLGTRYGLSDAEIAGRLNISPSMVSKLLYSYSKKH